MSNEENLYQDNKNQDLNETIFLKKFIILIIGNKQLSALDKLLLFINFSIGIIFLLWHLIGYFSIFFRSLILKEKNINIEKLIFNRGAELGFDPYAFLNQLFNFHLISSILWLLILISCFLMIRKINYYLISIFISVFAYYISMFFNLGTTYYYEDTTRFDKITIILFLINTTFYYFIFRTKDKENEFFTN